MVELTRPWREPPAARSVPASAASSPPDLPLAASSPSHVSGLSWRALQAPSASAVVEGPGHAACRCMHAVPLTSPPPESAVCMQGHKLRPPGRAARTRPMPRWPRRPPRCAAAAAAGSSAPPPLPAPQHLHVLLPDATPRQLCGPCDVLPCPPAVDSRSPLCGSPS